jgi:Rhodopirellula transposase DDE domain
MVGSVRYREADRLLITADGGGSNGSRVRLWKLELQKLADETGLTLQVCHYPPGTSKWNRIEHRMFCHITQTWCGKPLVSRVAVVELIAATMTKTGLTVPCELDETSYDKGIKVTDAEMATLNIESDARATDHINDPATTNTPATMPIAFTGCLSTSKNHAVN